MDTPASLIYTITVDVVDSGTPSLTSTATVIVQVLPVNENTPVFAAIATPYTIREDESIGTVVDTIAASDGDSGSDGTISYQITSTVDIDVVDSGTPSLTSTATVIVQVLPVNENTPVFAATASPYTIREDLKSVIDLDNPTNDANYYQLGVIVKDGGTPELTGTVSVTVITQSGTSLFSIDASDGRLLLIGNLDYEILPTAAKFYLITVEAIDGGALTYTLLVDVVDSGTPSLTSTATVIVQVLPVNENTPVIAATASPYTIREDVSIGTVVDTIAATDGDSGTDGTISYQITSTVDRPVFTGPFASTISEAAVIGTSVADVVANDPDTNSDFGILEYSIINGDPSNQFFIDSSTGRVFTKAVLDRETTPFIRAVDRNGDASSKSSTAIVTVIVTSLNELDPVFSQTTYTFNTPENSALGTSVGQVVATDADAGDDGSVYYSMETLDNYQYSVTVADQGTTPNAITTDVYIVITDVNDNSPVFTPASYTNSPPENQAIGSTIVTITASDADMGAFGEIEYSIISGNADGKFILDTITGALILKSSLDRETTDSYTIGVQAADKGTPASVAASSITITVADLNDEPPVCNPLAYSGSIQEDVVTGTSVLTVSCPDNKDLAPNNVVQYSITAGDPSAHFSIDINTGEIKTNSALNAQVTSLYSITVTATDGVLSTSAFAQITVTDVNQQAPQFNPPGPYTVNLPEDTALGFTVIDLDATDADPTAGPFIYYITGGNADNKFKIDSSTGVIILQNSVDADTTPSYSLSIEVADGAGPGTLTSTSAITVTLTGINDNKPVCNPATVFQAIPEGSIAGTVVTTLTCTDADIPTPSLVYSILNGNAGGEFALDSATGKISLTTVAFDYETKQAFTLEILVSDQGTTPGLFTATVQVAVTPINEHNPVFTGAPYTTTQPEDVAQGTTIVTLAATDNDQGLQHGIVRYSIVGGDSGGFFTIGITSGDIQVAKSLDFETAPTHTLTVRATDDFAGSGSERSVDTTLTITVTDINDNSPKFNPDSYSASVIESATVGATILAVTSTDDDSGVNKNAVYSITSGNANGDFNFVNNELVLAKTLDFETVTNYNLVVQVVDQGIPALTDTTVISIAVQPVNEDPPVLTDTSSTATISEDTSIGTTLYKATASDNDAGTDGKITYFIVSGNTNSAFLIDDTLGDLMVWSQLDFDTPPQTYMLGIEARDAGGMSDSLTLTITLTDVNDHTPLFTQNTYNAAINEGEAIGTSVTQAVASDADSGVNGQVTYSIVSGDGQASFGIMPATGVINTQILLDYEVKTLYYLVVQAVDGGTPALTSSSLVKVSINDINDNPPIFSPMDFTVNILEDVPVGTSVTTVNAKDADSTANSNNIFTYSLTDAYFSVDANTGEIMVTAALDRETIASHILTLQATDQGTPAMTGTATVTVLLDDINDNTPIITGTYDTNVAEDKAIGTLMFTVAATDADSGNNGRLTYTITNGNTNTDFKLDANAGVLQINKQLDRETTQSYTLQITVSDNGAVPKSDIISVVITIDDVNDNDPVFTGPPYTFTIAENVPNASPVNTVAATDQDVGLNAALVYDFVNFWQGNPTHFLIDASTGAITTSGALDRETSDTYVIRCRVQDKGSPIRSADVNVTITIQDLNDNTPVFDSTTYASTTIENSAFGTSILQVTVTDADIGVNKAVTLSIDTSTAQGTTADTFLAIDSANGILSVKTNIDRESNNNFSFQLLAVDGGTPSLTSTATVTLIVSDVNDNSPIFNPVFYNSEVSHAGQCSRVITTVTATDADEAINAQLGFFLAQQSSLFTIDGTSGTVSLVTSQSANTNAKYTLDIGVSDNGSPVLTAVTTAQIRIDTFIPNTVAVTFQLSISKADFEARRAQFIIELKALLVTKYPTSRVVVWCVEEREGTSISPPARRRLLATSPVNVHTYVVADDITDNQANLNQGKTFLTYDQILSVTTSDAATGTPSNSISGSAGWNYYSVEKVTAYVEETTAWEQTPVGIAIIVLCCLVALFLIGLLIFLCCRRHRKKKRPITPVKPQSMQKNREVLEKAAPVFVSKRNNIPDLNLNEKKHPLPAVLALPMPTVVGTYEKKPFREQVWGAPDDTKIPVRTPRVSRSPRTSDSNPRTPRSSSSVRQPAKPPGSGGGNSERVPRNIIIEPKEQVDKSFPTVIREFDGRAVDPATGNVYQYNTKTNERRWISTPDGHDIKVDMV
ncbi:protocadherin Fat 4 [Patella vulgata]|uniref:protocadherin Fat 4 n=1 Tax=Patella vulgata TaxID=6465 RepID=UPI0024A83AE5|nr:protocadherin Fat 4 [Patella vulgata]